MSNSHLGRNPFQKKIVESPINVLPRPAGRTSTLPEPMRRKVKGNLTQLIFVDIPAESFLFALKATALVRSVMGRRS